MRTGEDLEGWEETGQSEFSVGGSDSLCECGTWLMVVNRCSQYCSKGSECVLCAVYCMYVRVMWRNGSATVVQG